MRIGSADVLADVGLGGYPQKARTRDALVTATRELLARGVNATVEEAAAAAAVSRTTAYRYFPNQRTLLVAAHPEIDRESLLPADAPAEPEARLEMVIEAATRITLDWEPQLRASLRLSLEPDHDPTGPPLRRGRAIRWIEDALTPLRQTVPAVDVHGLALAIRSATGIEAFVWLVDVVGLPRGQAVELMRWSARALLQSALANGCGPHD